MLRLSTARTLIALLFIITLIVGASVVVYAQENTPEPEPDAATTPEPDDGTEMPMLEAVLRAEAAADRADEAADDAEKAVDRADAALGHANDLFGLFEAMSGAVALVVPFLAIAAGLLGFRRLENANTELRQSRERFEQEMQSRSEQISRLQTELEETARKQREESANASLGLALLQLGERQYKAQDYQGALDTYQRALNLDNQNPVTHYRMGYVYVHSDNFDKAKHHLSRSLELDPEFMPALAARGYTYRRIGDSMEEGIDRDIMYNKAEESFLKALNAFPKLIDEDGESWWGSLGGLYRRRGQIDQAIYAYEQCARAVPRSSYAYSNLALLYGQKQDIKRMKETYVQVEKLALGEIQADVDNYWAYADLIIARLALGKFEETLAILDTALNVAPVDSPYTLTILLDTLERLRQTLGTESDVTILPVMERIKQFQETRQDATAAEVVEDILDEAGNVVISDDESPDSNA